MNNYLFTKNDLSDNKVCFVTVWTTSNVASGYVILLSFFLSVFDECIDFIYCCIIQNDKPYDGWIKGNI